jgi:hypothetical protein
MKKILLLLLLAMPLLFVSCSGDEEPQFVENKLIGSTWVGTKGYIDVTLEFYEYKVSILKTTDNNVEYIDRAYIYEIKDSTTIILHHDLHTDLHGYIDCDTLRLRYIDRDEYVYILNKK